MRLRAEDFQLASLVSIPFSFFPFFFPKAAKKIELIYVGEHISVEPPHVYTIDYNTIDRPCTTHDHAIGACNIFIPSTL